LPDPPKEGKVATAPAHTFHDHGNSFLVLFKRCLTPIVSLCNTFITLFNPCSIPL
jgi:hypothetical protein